MEFGFLSILPSILSLVIAFAFKNVFIALLAAVVSANFIFVGGNPIAAFEGTLTNIVQVFSSESNVKVVFSMLLLGGLIHLIDKTGGIDALVRYLTAKKALVKDKKLAYIFTWLIGILVFTTGTLSIIIAGSISRPINDALKVVPEKSALIIHSTSTTWSVLVPISLWGPFMLGLISNAGVANSESVFAQSLYLNIYCILAVFGTLFLVLTGIDFGPMKKLQKEYDQLKSEVAVIAEEKATSGKGHMSYIVAPIVVMIVVIFAYMIYTGGGNIVKGNGYSAIIWGIILAILTLLGLLIKHGDFKDIKFAKEFSLGASTTMSVTMLLILAFAFGAAIKGLDAGNYLASLFSDILSPGLLPLLVFILSCIISFSTGTSLGTFTIMIPIAMAMATSMDSNIALVAAAVWGGGIFGDHCSPISDSTILSASVTGCDVHSHVKTTLPYAITYFVITAVSYLVLGFVL